METIYKLKPLEFKSVDEVSIPPADDRVIEIHGEVQTVTMKDLKTRLDELNKRKKESESMIENHNAKVSNIKHFHKWIKKMTEEEIVTCWLYGESMKEIKGNEEFLKLLETEIEKDTKRIEEIIKQIPDVYGKQED